MNKRLRILITCDDISRGGGAERVVANLSNAFVENGCEVWVYSLKRCFVDLPYHYDERVKLRGCLNGISFSKPKSFTGKVWREIKRIVMLPIIYYFNMDVERQFKRRLKSFKPDFVICNTHDNKLNKIFFKKVKTKGIKIVHNCFEFYEKRKIDLSVFPNVVLLTSREMNSFRQKYPNLHFYTIPNFIPKIPQENGNYSQKNVLAVGRFDKQKGYFRLIDIWQIIQQDLAFKGWKLIIVGDGELKLEIQEKIKTLYLEDSIILKPFTKEIEQEYLQASIYVMTSHYEGLPMVLIEAESFGLPCIAFDINTGPSDIIENEKSGYLVEDNDLEGYAEKLKTLMQDQNLRESMGKRAKEIVQEKFSKEVIMKKWFELFERLSMQERKY